MRNEYAEYDLRCHRVLLAPPPYEYAKFRIPYSVLHIPTFLLSIFPNPIDIW